MSYVRTPPYTYQQQADAVISQANPGTGTKYTVLNTTSNARIISISCRTTGGTVSLLCVCVTIDGQVVMFKKDDPTSAVEYLAIPVAANPPDGATAQRLSNGEEELRQRAFLLEGRSVKIEISVTWTVQPSPLVCRVKYAKIP